LHPSVAHVEDLWHRHAHQSHQQAADRRLDPRRKSQAVERLRDAVEGARVEQSTDAARHPEGGVVDELCGRGQRQLWVIPEHWREAAIRPEHGIPYDRCDEPRDDRLDLEVVDVENLARQQRTTEWSAEDRADTGADPGSDRDATVDEVEAE